MAAWRERSPDERLERIEELGRDARQSEVDPCRPSSAKFDNLRRGISRGDPEACVRNLCVPSPVPSDFQNVSNWAEGIEGSVYPAGVRDESFIPWSAVASYSGALLAVVLDLLIDDIAVVHVNILDATPDSARRSVLTSCRGVTTPY